MKKRVYNDWITSAVALLIGFVSIIMSGSIILPALTGPTDIPSKILWCAIFGPLFVGGIYCIVLSFVKGFDYWYVTKNAIHYKRPFRRKVVIRFDNIESVEHTTIKSLRSSKYSPEDVYIVHSRNKKIVIFTEEDRRKSRKQILNDTIEMLSKYPQR